MDIELDKTLNGSVSGLCGDFDGNPMNDIKLQDGKMSKYSKQNTTSYSERCKIYCMIIVRCKSCRVKIVVENNIVELE